MRQFLPILFALFLILNLNACVSSQTAANQSSSLSFEPAHLDKKKFQTVILLHGLNRTKRSMKVMAESLSAEGYSVCSIGYPSRYFSLETLAKEYVLPKIQECIRPQTTTVNYVAHSLGGIIIRQLNEELKMYPHGKLVMLSPPNQGSEAVDKLSGSWFFQQISGPVGHELGTDAESAPSRLAPPSMPFGIIAARHSNSPMSFLIPGDDDGKVSLERMQLPEMSDFIIVDSTHSFMMRNSMVIKLVGHFLEMGSFLPVDTYQ